VLNTILHTLFPQSCPLCGSPSSDHRTAPICPSCWQTIIPYDGPSCLRCAKPLHSEGALVCGECIRNDPPFTSITVYGLYRGALKKAINLLKYYNIKRLSTPLAEILAGTTLPPVDAVLPVPLYRKRLRQREFNQSALLARHIAKHIERTLILDCLVKIRDTAPQVGLHSGERRRNIRNAFTVQNTTGIEGRNILLIDDVVTTGATVGECARVLKKSGAASVYVLALAHGTID
jgi:ComF family protein